jgi:hypothetical protein
MPRCFSKAEYLFAKRAEHSFAMALRRHGAQPLPSLLLQQKDASKCYAEGSFDNKKRLETWFRSLDPQNRNQVGFWQTVFVSGKVFLANGRVLTSKPGFKRKARVEILRKLRMTIKVIRNLISREWPG